MAEGRAWNSFWLFVTPAEYGVHYGHDIIVARRGSLKAAYSYHNQHQTCRVFRVNLAYLECKEVTEEFNSSRNRRMELGELIKEFYDRDGQSHDQ